MKVVKSVFHFCTLRIIGRWVTLVMITFFPCWVPLVLWWIVDYFFLPLFFSFSLYSLYSFTNSIYIPDCCIFVISIEIMSICVLFFHNPVDHSECSHSEYRLVISFPVIIVQHCCWIYSLMLQIYHKQHFNFDTACSQGLFICFFIYLGFVFHVVVNLWKTFGLLANCLGRWLSTIFLGMTWVQILTLKWRSLLLSTISESVSIWKTYSFVHRHM